VIDLLPRVEIEVAVQDSLATRVVEEIGKAAFTGRIGDGRIIVGPLEAAVRIRTGETGNNAL
jgi:nitrogen regulatory protein P-II 1